MYMLQAPVFRLVSRTGIGNLFVMRKRQDALLESLESRIDASTGILCTETNPQFFDIVFVVEIHQRKSS